MNKGDYKENNIELTDLARLVNERAMSLEGAATLLIAALSGFTGKVTAKFPPEDDRGGPHFKDYNVRCAHSQGGDFHFSDTDASSTARAWQKHIEQNQNITHTPKFWISHS